MGAHAHLDSTDHQGKTALRRYMQKDDASSLQRIEALVNASADVNPVSFSTGMPPPALASDVLVARSLLNVSADLNLQDWLVRGTQKNSSHVQTLLGGTCRLEYPCQHNCYSAGGQRPWCSQGSGRNPHATCIHFAT